MDEQELRSLVREAIERHLQRPDDNRGRPAFSPGFLGKGGALSGHASHGILKGLPGSEIDAGACVIEPTVPCNHCGFCQSFGH